MAVFPQASVLFNVDPNWTAAQARVEFERWLASTLQLPGAAEAEALTIATGQITPTRASVIVDTEGGTSADDLTTIATTNMHAGAVLMLCAANSGRTVTVKHGTGAGGIALLGGVDCVLSTAHWLMLRRVGDAWAEMPPQRAVQAQQAATAAAANMSDTLRQGGLSAPTSAGTGAAYTVASSPAVDAYVSGRVYQFVAHTACSGAPTVNFDGLGAKSIKVISDGSKAPCAAADIAVGQLATCLYDGTDMVLIAGSRRAKGFQAVKTADQTGIASATATKVTFPSEIEDTDGWYNAATSEFTPPAGVYLISAQLYYTAGVVAQADFRVILRKNGSTFRQKLVFASGTSGVICSLNVLVSASGTDTFTIYAYGGGTGTKTVSGVEDTTFFSAYKVE